MKTLKFLSILMLAIAPLAYSCGDDNGNEGGTANVVLRASKLTIDADNVDVSNFTVTYDGKDVTAQATIYDNSTKQTVGTTFKSGTAGTYEFRANYEGKESNIVTIKAEEDKPTVITKDFARKSIIHQLTSVLCTQCPAMKKYLAETLKPQMGDDLTVITMHTPNMGYDPMQLSETTLLEKEFLTDGWPSAIIEQRWGSTGTKSSFIEGKLKETQGNTPQAAIRISNSQVADGTVNCEVKVYSKIASEYSINIYILEDDLVYPDNPQLGGSAEYVHSDVARIVWPNYKGDEVEVEANKMSTHSYSFSLPETVRETDNCRVVAILKKYEKVDTSFHWTVTNADECKLGSSNDDFRYK